MKNIIFCLLVISNCFAGASSWIDAAGFGKDLHDKLGKEEIKGDEQQYHPGYVESTEDAGTVFNPFTDPCWKCFFPIHVAGKNLSSSHKDFVQYDSNWFGLCHCKSEKSLLGIIPLPIVGFKIAFWEPQSVVEVTRIPYKFMTFKNMGLKTVNYRKIGTVANQDSGRSSFYNVHQYPAPLLRWMAIIPGFSCLKKIDGGAPIFMSEWDPGWNDMQSLVHVALDPMRFAFSTPEAQKACAQDCAASWNRTPSDKYFWCAGCLGSLYPYCGHVAHHIGGLQASSLLLVRWLAEVHAFGAHLPNKWNALGLGKGFEPDNFCEKSSMPRLKKTIYKTQLFYPRKDLGQKRDGKMVYCHPLGESDRDWGRSNLDGEEYTYSPGGEDFAYLVWTKMQCCLDVLDVFTKSLEALKTKGILDSETVKDYENKIKELKNHAE
jgi:conjugal transfer pilus assembly protein TraU